MFMSRTLRVCLWASAGLAMSQAPAWAQCGTASWYHEGKRTANGERYNPDGVSAAHRSLPFGTRVKVTHKRTGRSIIVRINDRGPFIRGRIIDLSRGAKRQIGMGGLAPVCLTVLGRGPRSVSADGAGRERSLKTRQASRGVYRATQASARLKSNRAERQRAARAAQRERRIARKTAPAFRLAGWPYTDSSF